MFKNKCFVEPCPNSKDGGKFKNNVCYPCWYYAKSITSGKESGWSIPARGQWINNNLHEVLVQATLEHTGVYYVTQLKERSKQKSNNVTFNASELDGRILESRFSIG